MKSTHSKSLFLACLTLATLSNLSAANPEEQAQAVAQKVVMAEGVFYPEHTVSGKINYRGQWLEPTDVTSETAAWRTSYESLAQAGGFASLEDMAMAWGFTIPGDNYSTAEIQAASLQISGQSFSTLQEWADYMSQESGSYYDPYDVMGIMQNSFGIYPQGTGDTEAFKAAYSTNDLKDLIRVYDGNVLGNELNLSEKASLLQSLRNGELSPTALEDFFFSDPGYNGINQNRRFQTNGVNDSAYIQDLISAANASPDPTTAQQLFDALRYHYTVDSTGIEDIDFTGWNPTSLINMPVNRTNLTASQINQATSLANANLSQKDLTGFSASGKSINGTNFTQTNVTGAQLNNASDYSFSNLSGLNLTGFNPTGRSLFGVNLSGTTGISISTLVNSSGINNTNLQNTSINREDLILALQQAGRNPYSGNFNVNSITW